MITRSGGVEEGRHGCTETGTWGVDRKEAQWDQSRQKALYLQAKASLPRHFSAPASRSTSHAPKAPVCTPGITASRYMVWEHLPKPVQKHQSGQ